MRGPCGWFVGRVNARGVLDSAAADSEFVVAFAALTATSARWLLALPSELGVGVGTVVMAGEQRGLLSPGGRLLLWGIAYCVRVGMEEGSDDPVLLGGAPR